MNISTEYKKDINEISFKLKKVLLSHGTSIKINNNSISSHQQNIFNGLLMRTLNFIRFKTITF